MRALFERIREVAATSTSVVIEGETGTGKELVANALHMLSARAMQPYRVVDCASISGELIESELFGHVRGAFTGALADRVGAFEDAHRGTIFIDEIGELPLELQPRLLRVLEKQELKRVGSETIRKINVRVLAATNRQLQREVKEGRFRQDLFYRLGVVRLHLPPLRERPDDIGLLAEQFLEELTEPGRAPLHLGADIRRRLAKHDWPGNVRELRNVISRGATLADTHYRLPEDFGRRTEATGVGNPETSPSASGSRTVKPTGDMEPTADRPGPRRREAGELTRPLWIGRPYKEAKEAVMADFECGYVRALLEEHQGNVSAAARAARIHRNILHRMIARYGIKR